MILNHETRTPAASSTQEHKATNTHVLSDTMSKQQQVFNPTFSKWLLLRPPRRQSIASPSPSTISLSHSSASFVFPTTKRHPDFLQDWETSLFTRSPTVQASSRRQRRRKVAFSCPCTVSTISPTAQWRKMVKGSERREVDLDFKAHFESHEVHGSAWFYNVVTNSG